MVNFLILMGLLRRYLYKPILKAIDQREETIAATLKDAQAKREEADKQRDSFVAQNIKLDQQSESLLDKAREEADREGKQVLEQARAQADKLTANRLKALREQEKELCHSLFSRTQKEAFELARQVLSDLGDVELQDQIVEVFLKRLGELKEAEAKAIGEMDARASSPVLRSAFELRPSQRASLEQAITSLLHSESSPRFEVSPDLLMGLELVTGGYKLPWNGSNSLRQLEEEAAEVLEPEPLARMDQ